MHVSVFVFVHASCCLQTSECEAAKREARDAAVEHQMCGPTLLKARTDMATAIADLTAQVLVCLLFHCFIVGVPKLLCVPFLETECVRAHTAVTLPEPDTRRLTVAVQFR